MEDDRMTTDVQVGAVMIREGFLLPHPLRIETESYSKCWRRLKGTNSLELSDNIHAAGWNYFFCASQIKATYIGWRPGKSADRAFARILREVGKLSLNSVEITEISRRRFLGIPYTAISAHGRHIQQSRLLQAESERRRSQAEMDWGLRLKNVGQPGMRPVRIDPQVLM